MGVQAKQSWLLVPALKGRLIHDSYLKAKESIHHRGTIKILDQAETLIPVAFDIVDESISSGYLRLIQPEPDQSFIFLVISVAFAIYLSCIQAVFKSFFVFAELGTKQKPATEGGESYRLSISEHIIAVINFLTNRYRAVIQLLVNIAREIRDALDRDGDGQIGIGDLRQCSTSALYYLGRLSMMLASITIHYALILVRKLVNIILPPLLAPLKPQVLFHQNSPKQIPDQKLERFERVEPECITITIIANVVYERLTMRYGPWFQRVVSWIGGVCRLLWQALRWCHRMVLLSFCRRGASNQTDIQQTST